MARIQEVRVIRVIRGQIHFWFRRRRAAKYPGHALCAVRLPPPPSPVTKKGKVSIFWKRETPGFGICRFFTKCSAAKCGKGNAYVRQTRHQNITENGSRDIKFKSPRK